MILLPSASPVAVGGVGGSGTRLIMQLLQAVGFSMGDQLNSTSDDMRFNRRLVGLEAVAAPEPDFEARLLAYLLEVVDARGLDGLDALDHASQWGWKEPNTHLTIHRIALRIPNIRYVHVMRNGLDMAYSANQQQAQMWCEHLLGHPFDGSPRHSLRYWAIVHRRIEANCMRLGDRFLLLNYDRLCTQPQDELPRLLNFAGVTSCDRTLATLLPMITPPASIGRYREHGLHEFDPADVDYVQSHGFGND